MFIHYSSCCYHSSTLSFASLHRILDCLIPLLPDLRFEIHIHQLHRITHQHDSTISPLIISPESSSEKEKKKHSPPLSPASTLHSYPYKTPTHWTPRPEPPPSYGTMRLRSSILSGSMSLCAPGTACCSAGSRLHRYISVLRNRGSCLMRWFPLFILCRLAFLSIQRRRRREKGGEKRTFHHRSSQSQTCSKHILDSGNIHRSFVSFLFILEIVLRGLKNWRGKKESADFALLYIITHFFHNLLTICSEP